MKKILIGLLIVLLNMGIIFGGGSQEQESSGSQQARLPTAPQAIGTHNTGTLFYLIGSGIASVATQYTPMRFLVQPYSGPSAWMPDLHSGAISFGIISYVEGAWTYQEKEGVPGSTKIRMLMKGNLMENLAWVTRQDSGINSIADLRGKRVAGGYGGTLFSQALVTTGLASFGMTWNDVTVVPVADVSTGLELLRNGQVVAAHGGTATSANTVETHQVTPLKVLPFKAYKPADVRKGVTAGDTQLLLELVPGTSLAVGRAAGILKEETVVYSYPLMLASSINISNEVVYQTLKACYDFNDELVKVDNWLQQWTRENMLDENFVVPYHDGAIRFYKELGLWTDALQKKQNELLALKGY